MIVRPTQRVHLAHLDDGGLVIRSQARRARCFQTDAAVEMDFAGITEIG